jgi:hypothetical protein
MKTVTRVTSRLLASHVPTEVSEKILAKFSNVTPRAVLPSDGSRESSTTATMGTSTMAVMTRMATKRHHLPLSCA